ncbi:MAG: hypothetical protein KKC75_06200 [Nanoarchaeota archaeon]|nr:hypothetical protein [Nanoarchaeota archaeon]MBU1004275.1 hypothetical protein [Nanoarchaeota archaeon]MBU1946152.1 hypothetical protein [Nanoarchaeota archaeon]
MNLNKMLLNKKGDMPWWVTRLIIPIALLILLSLIIVNVMSKGIMPNIASIFAKW